MILLDTHILVWVLIAPENLTPKEKRRIVEARKAGPMALSAISLWEVAWLVENKRVAIDVGLETFLKRCASFVQVLPITPQIAVRSVQFPRSYPSDPQDRIIGATAVVEGLRLMTRDQRIAASGQVPLVR